MMRIHTIPPSQYLLNITRRGYLVDGEQCHNMFVTYGIARYLSLLYPELRFINTLSYNRLKVKSRWLTPNALARVPIGSVARRQCVWFIVDRWHVLRDFQPSEMPASLIKEYIEAEEAHHEFELIIKNGRIGVRAYQRHILLKPIYRDIKLHNYFAHVMRDDGKIALYALGEETFKSDFIYDSIFFDQQRFTIYGVVDGVKTVIFQFHPHAGYCPKRKKPK